MKYFANLFAVLACGVLLLSGCEQAGPAGAKGANVAVIDLAAIAKATGQEEFIRVEAEAARNELNTQLQQLAANLDAQLQAEQERLGEPLSEANTQRMQELTMQAQQQVAGAQQQAQQQAVQIEQTLIAEFRNSIGPLAEKIARENGAQTVLVADIYMLWFDPMIDITGDVIAAWRAAPPTTLSLTDEVEQVQSDLAEVEDELAEAEADIEVLEEALDDGEEEGEISGQ